ncbi:MAG: hypothetical protein E6I72_07645 [Chloroflexi bacterium]|nr:MAG: hypothetical protein E6I72_07645 [Chloroflexota bacterium]
MTIFDAADVAPVPEPFVPATVKLYERPKPSPVTLALLAVPGTVAVIPPGFDVTVKLAAVASAATQVTVADRVPAVALTPVGAPGGDVAAFA